MQAHACVNLHRCYVKLCTKLCIIVPFSISYRLCKRYMLFIIYHILSPWRMQYHPAPTDSPPPDLLTVRWEARWLQSPRLRSYGAHFIRFTMPLLLTYHPPPPHLRWYGAHGDTGLKNTSLKLSFFSLQYFITLSLSSAPLFLSGCTFVAIALYTCRSFGRGDLWPLVIG